MRNAPSVLIPVGRSRLGAGVCAAAWLAGLALGLAWWWHAPAPGAGLSGAQVVLAGLLIACGLLAWYSLCRTPAGLLDGDGHGWVWSTADGECAAQVRVVADWQRVLLLRLAPEDGSGVQWLWLTPRAGPDHWRAVRRALYFRASRQAPPDGMAAMP
jgi:hypothetical protein